MNVVNTSWAVGKLKFRVRYLLKREMDGPTREKQRESRTPVFGLQ